MIDLGLKDKNVLITGGCNGIGSAITEKFINQKSNLILTTRSIKKSLKFINRIKNKCKLEVIEIDFVKKNWSKKLKKKINKFKIDVLINNAGHTLDIKNPYCKIDDWKKIINSNFLTAVEITNMVIPNMKKEKWGRIVNITSCAGLENSGPLTYSVSKAQLTAYSRTMGRILASECKGIVMTAIYPGVVKTKGGHWEKVLKKNPSHAKKYLAERTPLNDFGNQNEFADIVTFYSSRIVTSSHGSIISADGGQSRHYSYFNFL